MVCGFSLVEVTLALGVVSFALMSVLALLPNGLKIVQDSANESAMTSIAREVRAEVNRATFSDLSLELPTQTWYFNQEGIRIGASAGAEERYYVVTFEAALPQAPSTAVGFEETLQALSVRIRYPEFAPSATQKSERFTLHAARQSGKAAGA